MGLTRVHHEEKTLTPWTVEHLIASAERIMASAPELFASSDPGDEKELNVRLIRDYVVRDFIPRPARLGREARFGLHHLVHLLSVRALLRSQKWSLPAIKASFTTTSTEDLLNGVLARVRPRIEREYQKAMKPPKNGSPIAPAERVSTPILNPAQQLIEKFKAGQVPQVYATDRQLRRSAPMAVAADLFSAPPPGSRSSGSRRMLHVQLEPWCEVVIDAQRLTLLTQREIESLGEALKRRLHNETAE